MNSMIKKNLPSDEIEDNFEKLVKASSRHEISFGLFVGSHFGRKLGNLSTIYISLNIEHEIHNPFY